jgi:hypothetical protein
MGQTADGGRLKIIAVIEEFKREGAALVRRCSFKAPDEVLPDAPRRHGTPAHIHSANGSEFVAEKVRTFFSGTRCRTVVYCSGIAFGGQLLRKFQQPISKPIPRS